MTKNFNEQLDVLCAAEAHNKFTVWRPLLKDGKAQIDVPFVRYRTKAIVESIEGPSKLDRVILGLVSTGKYSDFDGIAKTLGAEKLTKMLRTHFNELRRMCYLCTDPLELTSVGNEFLNNKRQESHELTCDLEFYRNELTGKIVYMKVMKIWDEHPSFGGKEMERPFTYVSSSENILRELLSAQEKKFDEETDKNVLDDDVPKYFNTQLAPALSDLRKSVSKIQWFKRIEEESYRRKRITVHYAAIRFTKGQSADKEIDEEIRIYAPDKHDLFGFKYCEDTTNALKDLLIKHGDSTPELTPEWRS